jgi:UDP-N-acetylglucosamine--N-acetylmuramyl-(pentapeptide) pyrophosphoryl-undecaprenol N-acetylglucosamine transferase
MTIIIAAGGTGGHLYPGVALAREFIRKDPSAAIRFIGTTRGIEGKVLAHEGFALDYIAALPLMGLSVRQRLAALLSLPRGLRQSVKLLRRYHPDLVLGIGGYTSPMVVLAAWLLRIPRVILEPNAYPGMANKIMAPLAARVFVAFEATGRFFTPSKVRAFGAPIRREFLVSGAQPIRTDGTMNKKTLLVFGGSGGAHAINAAMMDALPLLFNDAKVSAGLSVVHQTGPHDYERVKGCYESAGIKVAVRPFLFDMPTALRAADLVVSRSGAMTLAELTVCGKPSVLIPFPKAIYQHQAHNADVLKKAGAALVIPQDDLTGARLAEVVGALFRQPHRLQQMSERSRALGRADSAEAIVRECLQLARGKARG